MKKYKLDNFLITTQRSLPILFTLNIKIILCLNVNYLRVLVAYTFCKNVDKIRQFDRGQK
jgi:hypothetical protein